MSPEGIPAKIQLRVIEKEEDRAALSLSKLSAASGDTLAPASPEEEEGRSEGGRLWWAGPIVGGMARLVGSGVGGD